MLNLSVLRPILMGSINPINLYFIIMEVLLEHLLALETMAVLLCFSAFFSGAETAFFSLSRQQITELRKNGGRASRLVGSLLDKPTELLIAILLGNTLVNILFFCTSAIVAEEVGRTYGGMYQIITGVIVLMLIIIVAEIIPKSLGVTFPVTLSLAAAVPLVFWRYISAPFGKMLHVLTMKFEPKTVRKQEKQISAAEMKMLLKMSREEGKLNVYAGEMIEDIMELSSLKVKHLMIPRTELVLCSSDMKVSEAISFAREQKFYFLICYKGDEENILGLVDIKELCLFAKPDEPINTYIKPPKYVPETKKSGELLDEMIKEQLMLVITVDEFGGISGIVTVKDILERIVGNMDGEFASYEEDIVEQLGDNIFRVKGSLSTSSWKDFFVDPITDEDSQLLEIATVGGFVTYLLNKIPEEGDTVTFRNMNFTVEEMSERRIEAIILRINE